MTEWWNGFLDLSTCLRFPCKELIYMQNNKTNWNDWQWLQGLLESCSWGIYVNHPRSVNGKAPFGHVKTSCILFFSSLHCNYIDRCLTEWIVIRSTVLATEWRSMLIGWIKSRWLNVHNMAINYLALPLDLCPSVTRWGHKIKHISMTLAGYVCLQPPLMMFARLIFNWLA